MDYNINSNQQQNNVPSIPQPTPDYTPKKYYSKKSLWKWVLLYLIIGAIAYGVIYYFFFYNKGVYTYNPQSYQNNYQTQDTHQANENINVTILSNDSADWRTYTSDNGYFSIALPPHWVVQTDGEYGLWFHGKEGAVNIAWNGLGGACDPQYMEKIVIDNEGFDVCHTGPFNTGSVGENWSLIYKKISPTVTLGIIAGANIPAKVNRDTVLKALKSIQFHIINETK